MIAHEPVTNQYVTAQPPVSPAALPVSLSPQHLWWVRVIPRSHEDTDPLSIGFTHVLYVKSKSVIYSDISKMPTQSQLDYLRTRSLVDCDTLDVSIGKDLGPFVDCTSNQVSSSSEQLLLRLHRKTEQTGVGNCIFRDPKAATPGANCRVCNARLITYHQGRVQRCLSRGADSRDHYGEAIS